jgi:dTDP-4-dehydrorhamnose 3,5-epimerase
MRFTKLDIVGAFLIEIEAHHDERGFFARTFCKSEFANHGMNATLVQCSTSFNARRGTLRGLHYQAAPHEETKIVRCTAGAIFDVIVDSRTRSSTFGTWFATELTSRNRRMMYVPEGVAHGFQTLEDESEVFYQISTEFTPEAGRGIRWDDPHLSIPWPLREDRIISPRDAEFPGLIP